MENVKAKIDGCTDKKLLTNLKKSYKILDTHWNQLNLSIERIVDEQEAYFFSNTFGYYDSESD